MLDSGSCLSVPQEAFEMVPQGHGTPQASTCLLTAWGQVFFQRNKPASFSDSFETVRGKNDLKWQWAEQPVAPGQGDFLCKGHARKKPIQGQKEGRV